MSQSRFVKEMFDNITPDYDRLNHLLSGWQDVRWRRFAVSRLPLDSRRVLDVATGTGDLIIEAALSRPKLQGTGLDFVERMLRAARVKTERNGLGNRIEYTLGDALSLPFTDNSFDAASMAFGLRNIADIQGALLEMARVVRPGGKVIVLEMTFPENIGLRKFFTFYLNHVIPFVGGLISGNRKAYRYLPNSIKGFVHPDELTAHFKLAGLESVKAFPLSLGIAYLHEGTVVRV